MSAADAKGEPATAIMIANAGQGKPRPATRPPPGRGRTALAQSWCDERAAIPAGHERVNADRGAETRKIGGVRACKRWEIKAPARPNHPSACPDHPSALAAGLSGASG